MEDGVYQMKPMKEEEKRISIKEKDLKNILAYRKKAKELQDTCRELEEKLKEMEKEISDWKNIAQRLAADIENIRKRSQKEKDELTTFIQASLAEKLIFFDEIFEKIVREMPDSTETRIKEGLEMLKKQFSSLLESIGVKKIETVGKKFDPMLHDAIEVVETDENPDSTIIEEIRSGYLINGKLLKPAQVKVSRGKTENTGSSKN